MNPISLSELRPGQSARIVSLDQDKPVSQKLLHLGVLPDKQIRFIKTAPMGDPLEFEVEGTNFSVRRKDAGSISVELIA